MTVRTNSSFFTRDKGFYSAFFGMFVMIALQNLIAYSVNMADNIMLGSYNQVSLSGRLPLIRYFLWFSSFQWQSVRLWLQFLPNTGVRGKAVD